MRRERIKRHNRLYGWGLVVFLFGSAGLAEAIEGHGSFLISAVVFSVGLSMILWSYTK